MHNRRLSRFTGRSPWLARIGFPDRGQSPRVTGACWSVLFICILFGCALEARDGKPESLSIRTADGRRITYQIEIADNDAARTRGLMYRKYMPADQGMLFDFKQSGIVSFWMKNTYIPLDMLFIDAHGVIVKIAQHTEPHSTAAISSEQDIRYVLELNAGQTANHGIKTGDMIELEQ